LNRIGKNLRSVLDFDLLGYIQSAASRSIFSQERRTVLFALATGFIAYYVFVSQQLLNNHALRLPWLHPNEQMSSGRWVAPYLGLLHYDADVPVFLPLLGIVLAAGAAILALRTWEIPRAGVGKALAAGLIVAFPAALSHFYYSFMTPLFFLAWLFAAGAMYVCNRPSVLRISAGAVLVMLTMATYQASLGIVVLIAAGAAVTGLAKDSGRGDIRPVLQTVLARALATGIGGISYAISLRILDISPPRSITTTSLAEIPGRLMEVATVAFSHLWQTQPDLLWPIKMTLLVFLALGVVVSLWAVRASPLRLFLVALCWPAMVVATKTVFLFAAPDGSIYEYRYNSSLAFLHAFSFAIVLSFMPGKLPRSLAAAAAAVVLVVFVQADLVRQLVLLRGQQHDLAIANRILSRIESMPEIDFSKTYDLVRVGRYSTYRYSLFRSDGDVIDRAGDGHMDFGEISDRWVDEDVFRLLGTRIKFKFASTDPGFGSKIQSVKDTLLEGRQPWPSSDSVFLSENTIVVYMGE
tara:strand:+ start:32110 stop:33678 length:1569 start_codon:yes stop_codon:yes gene_type:complete